MPGTSTTACVSFVQQLQQQYSVVNGIGTKRSLQVEFSHNSAAPSIVPVGTWYTAVEQNAYVVWSSEHLDNLTSPTAPSKPRSYTTAAEPSATRALSSEPGPGCSRHHLEHPTSPTIHYFVVKDDHRRANTEPIMKSPQGWPSPPDCDGQQEQQQYLDTRPIPWVPAPGKSSFAYHTPTTRLRTPGTW